jgi:hypothetical protein
MLNHQFTRSAFAIMSLFLAGAGTGFAAAPAALLNKSITVTWSESRDMKDVDNRASHRVVHRTMGIYVSSTGRMFMQKSAVAVVRNSRWTAQSASSHGPGGSIKTSNAQAHAGRELRIVGRSLVETVKFDSGARRVEIKFDDGFRACSVHVVYGKEGNTPIVSRGMTTRLHAVTSLDIGAQTCSVRDGNMFGE